MRRVMTHDELVANGWVSHPGGPFEWAWYQHPIHPSIHHEALGKPICRNKAYVEHPRLELALHVPLSAIVEIK